MKVLFIARHGPHDNQDEEAIAYALEQLGHTVYRRNETKRRLSLTDEERQADFCLINKWDNIAAISKLPMPVVFWFFDLVYNSDVLIHARGLVRINWMKRLLPHCLLGFCTDGDWLDLAPRYCKGTGKLRHLAQGADERYAGFGEATEQVAPVVFTGWIRHGTARLEHIRHLQERWGEQFQVIGNEDLRQRKHGRDLANLCASTKVMIAPIGPGSHKYWSNRAYLLTSLGGFLLHPESMGLAQHFVPGVDLVYYKTVQECDELIDFYLKHPQQREDMRLAGYHRTMAAHLYRHRCAELVQQVQEAL